MDQQVSDYLNARKKELETEAKRKKGAHLISLGLFEKVYSPDGTGNEEYRFYDWDDEAQKPLYYKKVPVHVTDEEYAEIKKLSSTQSNRASTNTNTIATALNIIAWVIFIGGLIAGCIFGNVEVIKGVNYKYTDTEFSFTIAATYWFIAFISGTMFLGFSEIVQLLTDIKNK